MPQLDPTWFVSQLFWLLVAFVALYVMLSRFALPPLMEIMARRQQTVTSDLDRAQQMTGAADRARQDYERALAEARSGAQKFLNDAAAMHKTKAEEAGKAMDNQVTGILSEAEKKIAAKKAALVKELTPASVELAGMIVEKLTKQPLANDRIQSIVNDVLKSFNR